MTKFGLSVIIPFYNEAKNLEILLAKLATELPKTVRTWEIILVDDGSNDNYRSLIKKYLSSTRVHLYCLGRRKGKGKALALSFKKIKYPLVITLDADLQDDPKHVAKFLQAYRKHNYDLVVGYRKKRQDAWGKVIASKIWNWLTRAISRHELHDINCGFRLYTRKALSAVGPYFYGDWFRFAPVVAVWEGLKVGEVKVKHYPRRYGRSKYNLSRYFFGLVDLAMLYFIRRFLEKPSHFFSVFGASVFLLGLILDGYILVLKITTGTIQSKYPLLSLAILSTISGLIIILFGFLAELIVFINRDRLAKPHEENH